MLYSSWQEAMEVFCENIDDATYEALLASDMFGDAMVGWCEANGHTWEVDA